MAISVRQHPALRSGRRRVREHASRAAGHVVRFLRTEQVGGLIMLAAAAAALVVANSPAAGWYRRLSATEFGPESLHLHLSLAEWATDGLLTLFFVVVGMELKHELVVGELREPRKAMLPIFAAAGGMLVPAAVALAVGAGAEGIDRAWAAAVATDIAFALAVLAIATRRLPPGLRVFLLTIAVVDDIGAIILIAVLFTASLAVPPLLAAIACVAIYWMLQRFRVRGWWFYVPVAVAAWGFLNASGVHPTLAGVAIGLATRVRPDPGEQEAPAERAEHILQPISAGIAVPLFAFMAAGVSLSLPALKDFTSDRAALAVVAGLVIGKPLGVMLGSMFSVRARLAALPPGLSWRDVFAVSALTGCGFTISLLLVRLAFGGSPQANRLTIAVLTASLLAAFIGTRLLRKRARDL